MADPKTDDRPVAARPGLLLPAIAAILIPTIIVLWHSIALHGGAVGAPDASVLLIAFLTQIGLGIIYIGEWIAYRLNASGRAFRLAGLTVPPVLACIGVALLAPLAIFAFAQVL